MFHGPLTALRQTGFFLALVTSLETYLINGRYHFSMVRKDNISQSTQRMLFLPVLAKACLLLGCSVLASLPMLAGAGRMARMGLAAASKEGLGLGLLFTSCPLCVAAVASVLKNKSYKWKNIPSISLQLQFSSYP